ncbi:MAG: hypothetical protein ABI947_27665 [Chloroflexota bacterium]
MKKENPQLTPLLRGVTFIECLALAAAGIGLFFLPEIAGPLWAWKIAPFNAGFLGAFYLASLVAAGMMLVIGRWSPVRLVLPMLLTFTLIVLIGSLIHLARFDYFDYSRWATWAWFALYIFIPINSAYHLWLYRRLPPAEALPTPPIWQTYLIVQGLVLGLYGIVMIVGASATTAFWPWPKIDDFHTQMYSAVGITAAIGGFMLIHVGSPSEFLTLGLIQIVFALFSVLDVVLKSSNPVVNYSAAGTLLWLGTFAVILLTGIGMILRWKHTRS